MFKPSNNFIGIGLALLASLALSNVYIFSKAALNEVHLVQFGVYWFGLGIIWNLIYIFILGKHASIKQLSKKSLQALLLLAVLEMFGTLFFFISIKTISNPAIVSFLANINPLYVTTLGIIFLKERFNKIEFTGMAILLLGALVISIKGSETLVGLFIPGVEYVLISGFLFSIAQIVAKKQILHIDTSILALSRILLLFVFSLSSLIILDIDIVIPESALKNIAIGSVLGPFLTSTLGYMALKYIEVSKASMVRSVRSLFVLVGAYIYFGTFPEVGQIIGGLLTIIGIVLLSFGKLKLSSPSQ